MPQVLYSIAARVAVDILRPDGRTLDGLTVEQVRQRYPDVQQGSYDQAMDAIEQAFREGPVEIDRKTFLDMLYVLPPVGHTLAATSQSFKLVERTCGRVTQIYAFVDGRFFRLRDLYTLPHDEIVARCRAAMAKDVAAQPA